MNLALGFLILSVVGLGLSVVTLLRVRLFDQQLIPTFAVGWLRGELALQTIAVEAIVTVLFVWGGVLDHGTGQLGMKYRPNAPEGGRPSIGGA